MIADPVPRGILAFYYAFVPHPNATTTPEPKREPTQGTRRASFWRTASKDPHPYDSFIITDWTTPTHEPGPEPSSTGKPYYVKKPCSVKNCTTASATRGLCWKHGGGARCIKKACSSGKRNKFGFCPKHVKFANAIPVISLL